MATVNIIATFCNANTGGHASVQLRVNSVLQGTYPMTYGDLADVVTEEEKVVFTRLMLKLHLLGKTPAQLRANMIAGFSATI